MLGYRQPLTHAIRIARAARADIGKPQRIERTCGDRVLAEGRAHLRQQSFEDRDRFVIPAPRGEDLAKRLLKLETGRGQGFGGAGNSVAHELFRLVEPAERGERLGFDIGEVEPHERRDVERRGGADERQAALVFTGL